MKVRLISLAVVALMALALGCGDDDVVLDDVDAGHDEHDASERDAGEPAASVSCEPIERPNDVTEPCEPGESDYAPGEDDAWDECISDDGEYHPIEPSISTIARVEAFEQIADLLWENDDTPSPEDFLEARMIYQEDEGLDSRVVRRYDPHFDAPDGTDCAAAGVPEQHPDYCVGPAVLQPVILGGFNAGVAGQAPREAAAHIEAALLYFLYVSTYKESLTCTDVAKDCDSSYAYYTGGEAARGGIGLARYVAEVLPEAHEAAWDGLLAVRCWRDLDRAVPAEDLELRDRAREQYDESVQRGLLAVLHERLVRLGEAGCDEAHRAELAFVTTLAGLLDGTLRQRLRPSADDLKEGLTADDGELDIQLALGGVGDLLLCW